MTKVRPALSTVRASVVATVVMMSAVLLAACTISKTGPSLMRSVTHNGITVSLTLSADRVAAGGQIPATLTITNSNSKTLFIHSCPSDGTFSVGVASKKIPFQPGNGLVLCGMNILPHHSFVQHEAIVAAYQGCGGPPQPFCLPGKNPIPPLPAGRYVTAIDSQGVPTVVPLPRSITVTVLPQNATQALLKQQAQWPRRLKMGYLGGYWGPSRPGRLISTTQLRGNQDGSTCFGTTCWSLALVGDQVFVLHSTDTGHTWRIRSPVIMGSSVGAWRRALGTSSAPVIQLDGTRTLVVMTPDNTFYLSPDAGADWYVTSQFGSVVSFESPDRGARHPRAPFELTASAFSGSNALRAYQSIDGVHWVRASERILPDLRGMRPRGLATLMSSLGLHGVIHRDYTCGGPPQLRNWPLGTIWGQDPQPYATVSPGAHIKVWVVPACRYNVP
jgi:hypothetical protein